MKTEEFSVLLKDVVLYNGISVLSYNLTTRVTEILVCNKEHDKLIDLLKDGLFNKLIESKFVAPYCAEEAKVFMQKIDAGAKNGECRLFVKDGDTKPLFWVRFCFVNTSSKTNEPVVIITIKNEDDDANRRLINDFYSKQITNGVANGDSYFIVNIDDGTIYRSYGTLAIKTKSLKEQVNYIASMCDEMSQQVRFALSKESLLQLSDKNDVDLMDVLIHNINGMSKWFKIDVIYVKHPLSGANFVQIMFINIDNNYREAEDIKYNATHDELTDLLNKRTFTNLAIEKIEKLHTSFWKAIIFIDIDNFKNINDSLGHVIGDRVLRGVAMGIKKSFRKNDVIGRVGGDEFMVLFSVPNLYSLYNRLNLLNFNIKQTAQIENISVSMGVVVFFDKDNDFGRLYYQADKAMYHAKEMGKNCFYVIDEHTNSYLNDIVLKLEKEKVAQIMKLKTNDFMFGHLGEEKIIIDYITPRLHSTVFDCKNIKNIENLSELLSKKDYTKLTKLIFESASNKQMLCKNITVKGNEYKIFVLSENNRIIIAFQNGESA